MKLILMDLYNSRPDANLLNTDDEDVVYLLAYKLIFHSGGKGWPANSTFTSYKYPMLLTVKGKRIVEDKL
ncbi:hypothetical protein [Mammaliicoccus lentus]|uniref:hypothetical protein n=1 Tax=Mammaliicoccus lentus TaxID=42858 RepID=UPI0033990B95